VEQLDHDVPWTHHARRDRRDNCQVPFLRFFNWDQEEAPTLKLSDRVFVVDKMDGSLGILYPMPDGSLAVATRGSFTSDQAIWATNWIQAYVGPNAWAPDPDYTYLFEIIYPENRIVVDYGTREDITFLMKIHNETGKAVHADHSLPGGNTCCSSL